MRDVVERTFLVGGGGLTRGDSSEIGSERKFGAENTRLYMLWPGEIKGVSVALESVPQRILT